MKAGVYAFLIIIWVLSRIIAKSKADHAKSTAKKSPTASAAQRRTPTVELHRPAPSMNRAAHRQFTVPDAPCIVCENTGEDHFQRDKARRIAQLDDWLKNGLIDRSEYLVLKDRYQRGI